MKRRLAAGTGSIDAQPVATVADPAFRRLLESAGIRWQEVEDGARAAMPPILSHHETLARLSGFRLYLTGEKLGFVSPGAEHPGEPETVFARLSGSDPEHILLVGRPGSGKTRTCFEVARIAEENGWRPFHIQHYEPLASNEDIAEAIFADRTPALVVIDTLSECQGLDLDGIRTRLAVEAQHRRVNFALLATVRPGPLRLMARSAEFRTNIRALFGRVDMRDDTQHTGAIRDAILDRAAPRTIARYGRPALAQACGKRPIFALLIAADIEHRLDAVRNPLDRPRAESPDLLEWLYRRLDEDHLVPDELPGSDLFAEPSPTPELLACAAAAAACPLPQDDLTAVAGTVLAMKGADPEKASRIVGRLLSVGWLETDGKRLAAVHDLVSDVLLQRVLMPDDETPIADKDLNILLNASLVGTRAFGRFAVAIGRVLRDMPADSAKSVQSRCARWLAVRARDVAALLAASPAYESGHTVARLLGGTPWTEVTIEHWDVLVGPWLSHHRRHREARHLLYLSLSRMPDAVGAPLVATAVRWLHDHGDRLEASFLLQALLRWDLSEQQRAAVRRHTLKWLRKHAEAREARWLITALLRPGRTLPPEEFEAYSAAARRWLARHGEKIDAFMLISHCLGSRQPELARQAAISGAIWVQRHAAVPDAAIVLGPLLRRTRHFTPELREQTLKWLNRHAMTYRGPEVIRALLNRYHILDAQTRSVTVRKAVEWLDVHTDHDSGQYHQLLGVMLAREDPDVAVRVITLAMAWIERHGSSRHVRFILRRLLRRRDLPEEVRRIGAQRTLNFVRSSSALMDVSVLLPPLLKDQDPLIRAAARSEAIRCMDLYGDQTSARYLLQALLQEPELDAEQSAQVILKAQGWLDDYHLERGAFMVLAAMLTRRDLTRESQTSAVAAGLAWLNLFGPADEAAFVLITLLRRDDLTAGDRAAVEGSASRWGHQHRDSPRSRPVMLSLLNSREKATAKEGRRQHGRRGRPPVKQPGEDDGS